MCARKPASRAVVSKFTHNGEPSARTRAAAIDGSVGECQRRWAPRRARAQTEPKQEPLSERSADGMSRRLLPSQLPGSEVLLACRSAEGATVWEEEVAW